MNDAAYSESTRENKDIRRASKPLGTEMLTRGTCGKRRVHVQCSVNPKLHNQTEISNKDYFNSDFDDARSLLKVHTNLDAGTQHPIN